MCQEQKWEEIISSKLLEAGVLRMLLCSSQSADAKMSDSEVKDLFYLFIFLQSFIFSSLAVTTQIYSSRLVHLT
jgi:hypothetical protein